MEKLQVNEDGTIRINNQQPDYDELKELFPIIKESNKVALFKAKNGYIEYLFEESFLSGESANFTECSLEELCELHDFAYTKKPSLQSQMIYNVLLNRESMTLKELKKYFIFKEVDYKELYALLCDKNTTKADLRERYNVNLDIDLDEKVQDFMSDLNYLVKEGSVVKTSHYDKGLIYSISDKWREAELNV